MKRQHFFYNTLQAVAYIAVFIFLPLLASSQSTITINMAAIDGIQISPENIFNYQVYSSGPVSAQVKGSVRYRGFNLSLAYSFNCFLNQGPNTFSRDIVHPQWQFSSPALQDLFFNYKILPAGTFEYCVTVTPQTVAAEAAAPPSDECLYHKADDLFLINLIDPGDKAKLIEFNPVLTWMANYSFSTELTYRIRVAEIKTGQNAVNAVMRNQPMYEERNLMQNSVIYPLSAKPLIANQWYAWTVDAYYKGILLGGSETWQFIIPDTVSKVAKANRSYIDVTRESSANKLFALGELKLKYVLNDAQNDSLYLEIINDKNKKCALSPDKLSAVYGDNRYTLDLANGCTLKHNGLYTLKIKTRTRHEYSLLFQYINPEFQH